MAETERGGLYKQTLRRKPIAAILLRLTIGWQLFYKGLAKLLTPGWTAAPYLLLSRGFSPDFFHARGSSPILLGIVDAVNTWALILIGAALILGLLTRLASAFGNVLLSLYYLVQSYLIRTDFRIPVEGHYLVVNKTLVELLVLVVFLVLPAGSLWGLDRLSRTRSNCPHCSASHPASIVVPATFVPPRQLSLRPANASRCSAVRLSDFYLNFHLDIQDFRT